MRGSTPGRPGLPISGWLRDVSIGAKLKLVILVFAVALVLQLGATLASLELSEAIRAYLVGESLWSKAQKDGVIVLRRYIRTGDQRTYADYRRFMDVVLNFRRARLEMDKPVFDPATADEGMRLGGITSASARDDMIWLYRCCNDVSFFAEAVGIWIEGDMLIDRLMRVTESARARIEAGTATPAYREGVLLEVHELNELLTEREQAFSKVMIDGAEFVHRLLMLFLAVLSASLLLMALLLAMRIARLLRAGVENLEQGIARVNAGDMTTQIPVLSADELGNLAVTFNHLVSERGQVQESLDRDREFLKSMLDSMNEGIAACDANGVITFFNRALQDMIGQPAEPMAPERWAEHYRVRLPGGKTLPTDQMPLLRALRGEVVDNQELVVGRQGGGRAVLMSARRIVAPSGQVLGAVAAIQDITERKAAGEEIRKHTQELERVNKELEQFAFATAHDLQTPLRGLVGYAQLLERGLKGRLEGDDLELLNGIVKEAMGMHRLVQSLLEYTRVSSQPNRHWANLNYLLTEAKVELQFMIKARAPVIHSEVLPTLYVDARQIAQLLRSLVENAIKFQQREPPEVWLKAQQRPGEWVISVTDAGIGIPKAHQQRIFQIFQRLHTDEQFEGAGIGLSLAEKIVSNHGGRIWVESEAGKGSTFFFSIPDA